MNITLKDVKKQKVTKPLASNNINVIYQRYPFLFEVTDQNHYFHLPLNEKITS